MKFKNMWKNSFLICKINYTKNYKKNMILNL